MTDQGHSETNAKASPELRMTQMPHRSGAVATEKARGAGRRVRRLIVGVLVIVGVALAGTEGASAHAASPSRAYTSQGSCVVPMPTVYVINQTAGRDVQYVYYRPYIRRRSDGRVFYGQASTRYVGEYGSGYPSSSNWFWSGTAWGTQNVFNSAWGFVVNQHYDVYQEIWWAQGGQWIHYDKYTAGGCYQYQYQWQWVSA